MIMRLPRRHVVALIVAYACSVLMGVIAVQYANSVDTSSNRQWCALITTLDDAYSSQRASTELGRRVARTIADLRDSFQC